jgi:hypothetical protein
VATDTCLRVGSLDVAACEELGVKPGSSYGRLKAGESVANVHGVMVHPHQVPDLARLAPRMRANVTRAEPNSSVAEY